MYVTLWEGNEEENIRWYTLTSWGALITPVLNPNWNIPRTAENIAKTNMHVKPCVSYQLQRRQDMLRDTACKRINVSMRRVMDIVFLWSSINVKPNIIYLSTLVSWKATEVRDHSSWLTRELLFGVTFEARCLLTSGQWCPLGHRNGRHMMSPAASSWLVCFPETDRWDTDCHTESGSMKTRWGNLR